jgi:sterol desaturase/sphingolipid hydroxylase (fatty acid hydroxylase superfamily)
MIGAALAGNQLGLGLSHLISMPWLVVLAAALLAQTFVSYWIHRWMHRTTFLWRFHRVHHADSSVDVSTSLRNHPLELVVQVPASAMVIVLLGAPATAVIAMQVVLLFNKVWEHADVSLPEKIERRLSRVIFTPALHRLHHSPERSLHDTNYGELFILWDYLFGTLNRMPGRRPVGLEAQVARPDRLIDQLCSPLYAV